MKATLTDIEERIKITPSRYNGILNYDIDNGYAERMRMIVGASGTASGCVGMKSRFLMGGGMKDKDFYKAVINRDGLRVDQLLRRVCDNMSLLPFIGLHVNYNALYQKIEVNYVPFWHMRLSDPDGEYPNMIALYDDWTRQKRLRIDKDKVDYVDFYDPNPEVIKAQVKKAGGWSKWKGQIYLYSPAGKEYPLATYDPILEDMQTDSKAKLFKFRNISTNFLAAYIVETMKFEDNNEAIAFRQNLSTYQGADNTLKMLHIEKTNEESGVELKKVDIQDIEHLYQYTETSSRDNIILNFLIPPILLIQTPGKMGTSKEMRDATAYYNGITKDERLVIEEMFKEVFKDWKEQINKSDDYSIIPFQCPISNVELTPDDAKKLVEILTNALLSPEQKTSIIKMTFSLDDEQANELVMNAVKPAA